MFIPSRINQCILIRVYRINKEGTLDFELTESVLGYYIQLSNTNCPQFNTLVFSVSDYSVLICRVE